MKQIYGVIVALILVISALAYVYTLEEGEEGGVLSYEDVLGRNVTIETKENMDGRFFVLDMDPSDSDFQSGMTYAATLTPLFVGARPGEEYYNPVIVGSGEKGVGTLLDLTDREIITLAAEDITAEFYLNYYTSSSGCFLVSTYAQAIAISPAASLTGMPILNVNDPTFSSTLKELNVKFTVSIGKTPELDGEGLDHARIEENQVNTFYLDLLKDRGLSSDYIVVTNPDDIVDYQDLLTEGKLPVPGISFLSAELASYHRAIIRFSKGLPTFDEDYGDGYTQLGIPREMNNEYAEMILEQVREGVTELEASGADGYDNEAKYLALVGGPVTLPMYSWDINDYQQDRQYTPSDYYYGDLNEDPYQELAVGRIFARSLTDASLLVLRSLAINEVNEYDYPTDTSSTIYDTVSEDWKENSLACVGTTKIGPLPGILTPTLANQTKTMTEAGFHVTSMGYDIATQAEMVKEIIDEMNYAVYYGHGGYDCWYSSVPDPIDADMLNGQDLKPGFGIAMACLTGMTDSVDIPLDQMISLAFLHSGYVGYIGATRVAYGLYDYEISETGAIRGTGALYLVDVFSDLTCHDDMDVGEALRLAKNGLIATQGWEYTDENDPGYETQVTVTQYVLYGDPAHNMWIPDHDG